MIIDPYTNIDRCVTRLWQEWLKHPKLIIAVDVDDTIFDYHNQGFFYHGVTDVVKRCYKQGFYIVPFTGNPPEKYNSIYKLFQDFGIEASTINKNPFPLPFGNDGKMYFNILLDDRAGLGQSLEILVQLLNRIDAFQSITQKI